MKEFEIKLTAKNVEIDGEKREKERILKEVDVKNKDFHSRISQMEGELKMKDNELEKAKKEHADFVKEVNDNSEDINLLRLRKTHAELKKDFNKLNDSHKKETEAIKKDRKMLEDELRTATLENININAEQTTMNDLFKCMKEFIGKAPDKLVQSHGIDVTNVNSKELVRMT